MQSYGIAIAIYQQHSAFITYSGGYSGVAMVSVATPSERVCTLNQ